MNHFRRHEYEIANVDWSSLFTYHRNELETKIIFTSANYKRDLDLRFYQVPAFKTKKFFRRNDNLSSFQNIQ